MLFRSAYVLFGRSVFFVWLIFTDVCLCLYCCVLHIRTREARLVTYEATFLVFCLCVLRDRASRSPASVSVEASLPWLLFRYSCTSRDTRDVSMWWCHTVVSLQTTQPCLCHHSFVHPGGLYLCLENANSKYLCDKSRNSVPVYAAVPCVLYLHSLVSGDTLAVTLRACGARRLSVRGCGGYDSSCLCFYMPVPLDTLKLWLFHFSR